MTPTSPTQRPQTFSNAMLLFTAVIWGSGFCAQRAGMERLGPVSFAAVRFIIATTALVVPLLAFDRRGLRDKISLKRSSLYGLVTGAFLFTASLAQQIGLVHATAGKAAFVTALYIVLTPIGGMLFGRKTRGTVWIAVTAALTGMAVMCIEPGVTLGQGDLWLLLCAVLYTGQILAIDRLASAADVYVMSWVQTAVCAVLSTVSMFIWEKPTPGIFSDILASWFPLLYAGVMSCAVAYTLQIIGQHGAHPTTASLLMSLESVFAALFGWLLLGERMTGRQTVGAAILFAASVAATLWGSRGASGSVGDAHPEGANSQG